MHQHTIDLIDSVKLSLVLILNLWIMKSQLPKYSVKRTQFKMLLMTYVNIQRERGLSVTTTGFYPLG